MEQGVRRQTLAIALKQMPVRNPQILVSDWKAGYLI